MNDSNCIISDGENIIIPEIENIIIPAKSQNIIPNTLNCSTLTSIPDINTRIPISILSIPNLNNIFSKLESRLYLLKKLDERRCRSIKISNDGYSHMTIIMKVFNNTIINTNIC